MKAGKFTALAAAVVVCSFTLAGCQSVGDQMAEQIGGKIAESVVEQATGGQAKVDLSNGSMKIKTDEGEVNVETSGDTVRIKSDEGETVFGSGDTRPEEVSQDLPSPDGAKDFSWAGSKEEGVLSFVMDGLDYKSVCDKEITALQSSGWTLKEDFMMDFEGMMTRTLDKEGFSLSLSCSAEEDDNDVSVVMIKSQADSQ